MFYNAISQCPDCGAPVWAILKNQNEDSPPKHIFSCDCRLLKEKPAMEMFFGPLNMECPSNSVAPDLKNMPKITCKDMI